MKNAWSEYTVIYSHNICTIRHPRQHHSIKNLYSLRRVLLQVQPTVIVLLKLKSGFLKRKYKFIPTENMLSTGEYIEQPVQLLFLNWPQYPHSNSPQEYQSHLLLWGIERQPGRWCSLDHSRKMGFYLNSASVNVFNKQNPIRVWDTERVGVLDPTFFSFFPNTGTLIALKKKLKIKNTSMTRWITWKILFTNQWSGMKGTHTYTQTGSTPTDLRVHPLFHVKEVY